MARAVFPGSFDPLTNGHLDVIQRACHLVEELVVAVVQNPAKRSWFSLSERTSMLEEALAGHAQVQVDSFAGLLVDYVRARQARWVVKGLRGAADFEWELQMARLNRVMAPQVDSLFLMTSEGTSYISSSFVREIAALGGDVQTFVPPAIFRRVQQKLAESAPGGS